jgi:arabinoxylan arabinofuranohydrolase
MMKKQGFNPYLPSWEYIPDGEPHVFDGRVYVYGSHDRFNGHVFCLNDYVCWSAAVDDLADWHYEGLIYKKTADPLNPDGRMCLYAPDMTRGPDGRYYLYYVLDKVSIVSVAVCDTPAGKYEFLGYVHYADGTHLGKRPGDQPQFDPGVLTEGDKTYLYTGFCLRGDETRNGAMATMLGADMLTVMEDPLFIAPSAPYSKGSGFEGHEFFEASSIRKRGDTYYFVYSSVVMHELCYATSKHPRKDFKYQGVLVSNNDLHIDSYKPAEKPTYYGGNNHGGIVEIDGEWYIFYHRHTNGTSFSRQGCMERLQVQENGSIPQVEMTSCGPNGGPLIGRGEYPAYLACNLFCKDEALYTSHNAYMDNRYPKITQDGKDGDEEIGYIANMMNSAAAGFKYFDCQGVSRITIKVRGYCKGDFQVKTTWDGDVLGIIPVRFTNIWTEYSAEIKIPDGITALYFVFAGEGIASLGAFRLE